MGAGVIFIVLIIWGLIILSVGHVTEQSRETRMQEIYGNCLSDGGEVTNDIEVMMFQPCRTDQRLTCNTTVTLGRACVIQKRAFEITDGRLGLVMGEFPYVSGIEYYIVQHEAEIHG